MSSSSTMAGVMVERFKLFDFYLVFIIFTMCNGAYIPSHLKSTLEPENSVSNKLPPRSGSPTGEEIYHDKNFYHAQDQLGGEILETENNTSNNVSINCSYKVGKTVPLDLTKDGYLQVNVASIYREYYPPTQFCIPSLKTGRLLQSQVSPQIWRKCCPENQVLSGTSPQTCVNSSKSFRPNIDGDPQSFIVKPSTTNTFHLACPTGYLLKKLTTKDCRSSSRSKVQAVLASLFWNADDEEESPPCSHCSSFQLFPNGSIGYEEPTGVFLVKSQRKVAQPVTDHYCIDGVINPPVSDCNNGQLDHHFGCDDGQSMEQYRDIGQYQQQQPLEKSTAVLYICLKNDEPFEQANNENATAKTTLLAVIWALTCPLLFGAALGNCFVIQKNVHGWVLTCYLLSMCVLNILSVLFILNVGRDGREQRHEEDEHDEFGGCQPIHFAMKFTYMSTLCWMTSINFGLWKTFRYTLPEPVGIRRFIASVSFSLGFPLISVTVSYYMAKLASDHNCISEYCILFSYNTIPFYSVPIWGMVLGNLAIFIKTSCTIVSLRKESADILRRQAEDHLKSFALFAKLFLLTGSIWLIRLVLFVLQVHGLYLSWYGILLEVIFSIPEIVFPMIVFHHPEFIKWSWRRAPRISGVIHKFNPLFEAVDSKQTVSMQS